MKCTLCGRPTPKASGFCKFCVEKYVDKVLLKQAEARMKNAETDGFLTQEQMLAELGLEGSELDEVDVDAIHQITIQYLQF